MIRSFRGIDRGPAGTIQRHGRRVTSGKGPIVPTLCHMVEMVSLGLIIDSRNIDDYPTLGEGVYHEPIRGSIPCRTLGNATVSRQELFEMGVQRRQEDLREAFRALDEQDPLPVEMRVQCRDRSAIPQKML